MTITYQSIGTIRTPFKKTEGMPIQPSGAKGVKGKIELRNEFIEGLLDLEGFSHIILLYHFHKSEGYSLKVIPFLDDKTHGLFTTRAPRRPNSIGMSIVKLTGIVENILEIENVDMLDGTPLLDIKPYIPDFDFVNVEKTGWHANHSGKVNHISSDNRFS